LLKSNFDFAFCDISSLTVLRVIPCAELLSYLTCTTDKNSVIKYLVATVD